MHVRVIAQKTKSGRVRRYTQIVKSIRRPDGMPAKEVVAHLGVYDPVLTENLKLAFAASRRGERLMALLRSAGDASIELQMGENLTYLPFAVVSLFFRGFGLHDIIEEWLPPPPRAAAASLIIEALVAHRCIEPGSKLAFQDWSRQAATDEILGVAARKMNNTRVHRVLDGLARVDNDLQDEIASRIVAGASPRVLYLDLTDTWFEAGGGGLARRGKTKQGHRSKRKIHIALLVNEQGLPMRWRLLPGALSETTVLPEWLDHLAQCPRLESAVLIFDRGMPSAENFQKLVGNGQLPGQDSERLFLTSVKSDAIPTYTKLKQGALDALQALPDAASSKQVAQACSALGLLHIKADTYARDLKIVTPPKPRSARRVRPPRMRMFLYFNREIQITKRAGRDDRIDQIRSFVIKLNDDLRKAKQPRKPEPTLRKVTRLLEKLKLLEIYNVRLEPYKVPGKTKPIASLQVIIELRENMLRNARRYDGINLLVGHPQLDMTAAGAIAAYRQKNVVEADFRTIKSVLKLRPTFHWTDAKIQSHVTICTLALLIERLIEQKLLQGNLSPASRPDSADALLKHLLEVRLEHLLVDDTDYTTRTTASQHIRSMLQGIDAEHLLDAYPSSVKIPVTTA